MAQYYILQFPQRNALVEGHICPFWGRARREEPGTAAACRQNVTVRQKEGRRPEATSLCDAQVLLGVEASYLALGWASPSGKIFLLTKKKTTIEMPPFKTVVPML